MSGKTEKVIPKTLPGFMELLPSEQILFNQLTDAIRNSYERFGFLPLDTPVIESADVLLAKTGGETEKQIYSFSKGDTNLALRFDLTVPLAKYIALNQNNLAFPFRRYQIGKVYRGERPQQGRFREFYQCDIDIIGDGELNIMYDAEIPSVIYTTFKEMGFDDFTIRINNRKILNGLFASLNAGDKAPEVLRIIDKKDKIGDEAVVTELKTLGLTADSVDTIMNFISISGTSDEKLNLLKSMGIGSELFKTGVSELEQVIGGIKMFGVPDANFAIDLTIARGLDYYTGTVYETFLNQYRSIGSVCSGGRYDNLSEFYTDKKLPGVGISIGLTRLFYQLNKMNLLTPAKQSVSDVLVIPMTNDLAVCLSTATELRNQGVNAEVYLTDKKAKAKFGYADKLKIPFAVIIGDDEIKSGKFSLKNLTTGKQQLLTLDEIAAEVKPPQNA
ncbi:MAG: histidine--tRNA ligase [Oscillospiraceae bacterium]|jgi:histidyl-tRNA synthetase|nr:histidine--tRNA ligase [Oscillospiraceae bacterium]